ncbi:hypothetical protein VTL71DRAFT_10759 [Oculimacula yallundae]|uniref:Uncharacterized protein n=1 Tax=Oculimacula yallundae TaxID=86028 RepID=A0ABR4CUA8_9HELO
MLDVQENFQSEGTACVYASSPDSDSGFGDSSPSPPAIVANQYASPIGIPVPAAGSDVANVDTMDIFDDLMNGAFPVNDIGTEGSLGLIARPLDPSVYNTALTTTPGFPGLDDQWASSLLAPVMTPPLVQHSMETLLRAIRTWPRILCKGFQLPPMFHHSILSTDVSLPLANCCTLVKMWEGQFAGTNTIVHDTVMTEIKTLFRNFKTYDETESLAALQAITIYAILLVFPSKNQKSIPFLDTAIFSEIQQIVRHTAISGLVLQEENENSIPSWDAWVHVTSKRRAVFTLYLLHWAYSVYHHVPSFNCDELAYIPAPAPKYLWLATSEEQWKDLYVRWLAQWKGRQYMQHEFMFVEPGPFLDERTQLWLEDTDEFGMMFMSILVNATDREDYGFLPRCFTIPIEDKTEPAANGLQPTG